VRSHNLALTTALWPEHLTVTADLDDGRYLLADMCCKTTAVCCHTSTTPGLAKEWIAMTHVTLDRRLVVVWADGVAEHLGRVGHVSVDTEVGL
jgi:hypothetical protein